ncbi:MAG: bifunctional hydroxymethylpyrimidine kinase/phosphomethylpyrimidine kinase [Thermoleophilia bacterium]
MKDDPGTSLTIAGLDPSGGAGVVADIRAMKYLGVYAACVVTALTVQDTRGVAALNPVDAGIIADQLDLLLSDIHPASTKTGILPSREVVEVVAGRSSLMGKLVVDPVFVSSLGAELAPEAAVEALIGEILPRCELITPNIAEAERISGIRIESLADAERAAATIHAMGARAVCVTGGHWPGDPVDIYCDQDGTARLAAAGDRAAADFHGTGCIFAALAAASLANGNGTATAVRDAKRYVREALEAAIVPGSGTAVPWL